MKTERPSDEELKELIEVYGPPSFKERQVHLEGVEYKADKQESKGKAVIEVKKDGMVAGVRSRDGKKYVLPQGDVSVDEGFVEGARRICYEETGVEVKIIRLKEIRRIQIKYFDELVERWYFLFETERIEEELKKKEFEGIKFLEEVSWEEVYQ